MALFGNGETKEQKELRKAMEVMQKYGLDSLDPKYVDQVQKINMELAGTGFMEAGMKISMAPAQDQLKISYLNTLIAQNWIIIRLLDEINKK